MPITQIDDLAESAYWRSWHALNDVARELSLSPGDIRRISRMMQETFSACLRTRHKLDSTLRLKVETLITGGDYPED